MCGLQRNKTRKLDEKQAVKRSCVLRFTGPAVNIVGLKAEVTASSSLQPKSETRIHPTRLQKLPGTESCELDLVARLEIRSWKGFKYVYEDW